MIVKCLIIYISLFYKKKSKPHVHIHYYDLYHWRLTIISKLNICFFFNYIFNLNNLIIFFIII